ncbi:MAG: hypothetical protein J6K89_06835, partial [Oscillospiraceae bacterium]|nr:hypothetical protein [Oscillospiraceae bacterium]
YCRMNILHRLWRQEQYYRLFLGGFAAMPLTSGIIKRLIRFIRNKYKDNVLYPMIEKLWDTALSIFPSLMSGKKRHLLSCRFMV